ncbi:MAG: hypothetical protein A2511_07930 [Deltaproteobacteria bacterium RIFOXYD12_FULL_50_9]|nr:MAG: hypothetical protein A2511_07930 [Deltaproteobacteria bacterium RIFOXYD12_FULL_50_9]
MKKILTISAMLLFLSSLAIAADQGVIKLKSVAEVEVAIKNSKGEKEVRRVEAAKANVIPGDAVIFTTYCANNGNEPASDIVINNPMPEHLLYIAGTAEGSETKIEFSVDKGKSYATPDKLKIKGNDGKERPAGPSDYTHIRWTLSKPLAPGGQESVSFRAKVM